MEGRGELWVTCRSCDHTWVVAYLPMDMRKFARLTRSACCPKCGERRSMFLAREEEIARRLSQAQGAA